MSVSGIEAISGFEPLNFMNFGADDVSLTSSVAGTSAGTSATSGLDSLSGVSGTSGSSSSNEFGDMLLQGIDSMESRTDKAADLSVKAATGDLDAIHDYTIAASEAQLATQLTVAVRDKAVSAFQQIMQMQV
ncbi:flagellar hook-basal body complex protein FliE [Nocardioides sp.]|jgi:flagellar hook-basal body complex protein FliE|uniref:flagellar hook-basal body complex protein FliE n=1 Tax=Nocardioides sp. TaxID=35761 RepID=UPI00262806C1|nr:flagellar hook-basal body complex protein FliE [Nocardioides sp.]